MDTPFADEIDVVNRLLPYHVFQQPREDLEGLISKKGKEKAVDQEWRDEFEGLCSHTFVVHHLNNKIRYKVCFGVLQKTEEDHGSLESGQYALCQG